MTNGIFKSQGLLSYARAQDVMSTKSAVGFEWSVKLFGNGHSFYIGIASRLQLKNDLIPYFDRNAILYCTSDGSIQVRNIRKLSTKTKSGHVIRFRFQPRAKKLLIDSVRVVIFHSLI